VQINRCGPCHVQQKSHGTFLLFVGRKADIIARKSRFKSITSFEATNITNGYYDGSNTVATSSSNPQDVQLHIAQKRVGLPTSELGKRGTRPETQEKCLETGAVVTVPKQQSVQCSTPYNGTVTSSFRQKDPSAASQSAVSVAPLDRPSEIQRLQILSQMFPAVSPTLPHDPEQYYNMAVETASNGGAAVTQCHASNTSTAFPSGAGSYPATIETPVGLSLEDLWFTASIFTDLTTGILHSTGFHR